MGISQGFLCLITERDSSGPNLIEPLVMLHRKMEVLSLLSCRVFGDPKTEKLDLPGC
jgi:hypothetical protein